MKQSPEFQRGYAAGRRKVEKDARALTWGRALELALPLAFAQAWARGKEMQSTVPQKVEVAALIADAMIEEARKRGAAS